MIRSFLAFAICALVSTVAQARTLDPYMFTKTATITQFHVDPALSYAKNLTAGEVSVNVMTKEVALFLERRFECRTRICPQVMPAPIIVRLKLENVTTEKTCNTTIYLAKVDQRPVDGNLDVLRIVDNTRNTCMTFARLAATHITHKVVTSGQDGNVGTYTSTFYASPLVRIIDEKR